MTRLSKAADSSKKAAEKPAATKSDVPEDHSIGNYLNGAVGPESDNPQMVAENPDAGNVDSSPQVGVPQEEHDGPPQQEDASNQPPPAGESGPGDDSSEMNAPNPSSVDDMEASAPPSDAMGVTPGGSDGPDQEPGVAKSKITKKKEKEKGKKQKFKKEK
jgi:hypothetical protein